MTVTVKSVVDRSGVVLNDVNNVTWPRSELVQWVNDGQRELVRIHPDAKSKTVLLALVAGARQSLPADGIALIELRQNDEGPAIVPCDRASLDAFKPDWMVSGANNRVRHFIPDAASTDRFYVYPPQPSPPSSVLASYAAYPATVAETGAYINLDVRDIYAENILNYVLYRAYSKDTEFADGAARAAAYYQLFKA